MFAIYSKTVGGRSSNLYFKEFSKAEKYLLYDVEGCKRYGFKVTRKNICFNQAKGLGIYEIHGETAAGEPVLWSIYEGHFVDQLADFVEAVKSNKKQ